MANKLLSMIKIRQILLFLERGASQRAIVYNIAADYYTKWKGDWLYAKEMERTGRGQLSWVNFFLLKLIGTLHVIYANYKRGYITGQQMINFEKDYRILM